MASWCALQEIADIRDYSVEKRREELPQLWASRGVVNMDALQAHIGRERDPARLYLVLVSVLQV